jgi:hypothetical protein
MNAAYSPSGVGASAKSLIFIILLANFLELRYGEVASVDVSVLVATGTSEASSF